MQATPQRRIYLDQAATTWPKLPSAVQAAHDFIQHCGATSGRGAYRSARTADQFLAQARHYLARLVGARDANDVALCNSGTHALNAAISGLLRPGDCVITTTIEHNSVLRPLEHWRQMHGIQLHIVDCDSRGRIDLEKAETTMPQQARLVIVSHASNVTGAVQDLSAWSQVARQRDALLLVDASQTVGYLPIEMEASGVDVLASAGHKGLEALVGTGFLVATPSVQSQLSPLMLGGTGVVSELLDIHPAWPQSIEVGNLNMPGIVSMSAAAEHWLKQPVSDMQSWRHALERLLSQLRQRFTDDQLVIVGHDSAEGWLPVVSALLRDWDVHEAAAVLDASFGIEVRAGYHCAALVHAALGSHDRGGTLRLSLGHHTTELDVDDAVHALSSLLSH